MNEKTYEVYKHGQGQHSFGMRRCFRGKAQKQNHEGLRPKTDNIIRERIVLGRKIESKG